WSETAGPWVKPEQAMKKVVWSETAVRGPRKFSAVLAHPPSNNGRFQNVAVPPDIEFPKQDMPGSKPQPKEPPAPPDPTYYAEIAVIASRVPDVETTMADLHPKVTSSDSALNVAALMDGDVGKSVALAYAPEGKPSWIGYEFPQPF